MRVDIEILKTVVVPVFAKTPIVLVYAHGSRIHGHSRPDSDLDLGYYLRPNTPALGVRREVALAVTLGDALGLEVDLRDLGPAPLDLRGDVLERGVCIYSADEVFRVNLERETLSRYHDYKPEFEAMHRRRLQKFARGVLQHG